MKSKNLLSLIVMSIVTLTFTSSCVKEIYSSSFADQQNEAEEKKIEIVVIEEHINIEGAIRLRGTPPAPNSSLNFQLNSKTNYGFQNKGLDIKFTSNDDIAGAYIAFKDTEGNYTESFYDIPSSSFKHLGIARKNKKSKNILSNNNVFQENKNTIEVNFEARVHPGQFCYDICLYDASNNISQIQTACVTVEAWGGNSDVVGEWTLDEFKIVEDYDPSDYDISINCDNGQSITLSKDKETKRSTTILLNEYGTFVATTDITIKELDHKASINSCTGVYTNGYRIFTKESGNWAYNEEEKTLTLITFKFEDLEANYSKKHEKGIIFRYSGKLDFISNQLVISAVNENNESILKAYFNK